MPNVPNVNVEEWKWYWGVLVGVVGFIAGIFTAGMATQRVMDKYVTKEYLTSKCKGCDENLMRRKTDRDALVASETANHMRELQNIHGAIANLGNRIIEICEDVAEIRGRLTVIAEGNYAAINKDKTA